MSTKEKIIDVLDFMTEEQLDTLLDKIRQTYIIKEKTWEDIPEEEPDEIDLIMLQEIESNPDCQEFVSSDEVLKAFDL